MKFVHSPLLSQALPVWRARLLLLGLLAGFVALALYSLYLQSFNSGFLQEKGASRYSRVIELSATRGRITDRHGEALAVSTPVKSIWAIPEDAKLQPAQARELAGMLEMDVSELSQKLATGKEGMGYGDFKLLAALGAWLGWQMLPLTILLSSLRRLRR